jgi:hypothetical protein
MAWSELMLHCLTVRTKYSVRDPIIRLTSYGISLVLLTY